MKRLFSITLVFIILFSFGSQGLAALGKWPTSGIWSYNNEFVKVDGRDGALDCARTVAALDAADIDMVFARGNSQDDADYVLSLANCFENQSSEIQIWVYVYTWCPWPGGNWNCDAAAVYWAEQRNIHPNIAAMLLDDMYPEKYDPGTGDPYYDDFDGPMTPEWFNDIFADKNAVNSSFRVVAGLYWHWDHLDFFKPGSPWYDTANSRSYFKEGALFAYWASFDGVGFDLNTFQGYLDDAAITMAANGIDYLNFIYPAKWNNNSPSIGSGFTGLFHSDADLTSLINKASTPAFGMWYPPIWVHDEAHWFSATMFDDPSTDTYYKFYNNGKNVWPGWYQSIKTSVPVVGTQTVLVKGWMYDQIKKSSCWTWNTGSASAVSGSIVTDSSKTWTTNAYAGKTFEVTSGNAIGSTFQILSNTTNQLTLNGNVQAAGMVAWDNYRIWVYEAWDDFYYKQIYIDGVQKYNVDICDDDDAGSLVQVSQSAIDKEVEIEIRYMAFRSPNSGLWIPFNVRKSDLAVQVDGVPKSVTWTWESGQQDLAKWEHIWNTAAAEQRVRYFVDPGCGTPGDGSTGVCDGTQSDNPFNSMDDINLVISDTDDVYFKSGTTLQLATGENTEKLILSKNGTAADRIIIGCYWLDGSTEKYNSPPHPDSCIGNGTTVNPQRAFPIIRGSFECDCTLGPWNQFPQSNYPDCNDGEDQWAYGDNCCFQQVPRYCESDHTGNIPNNRYEGVIYKSDGSSTWDTGYVTIEQIEFDQTSMHPIYINGPDNQMDCNPPPCPNECRGIIIRHNKIHEIGSITGIALNRCHDSLIEHNLVYNTGICSRGGASIEVSGMDRLHHSYNNLIQYNTVYDGEELIALEYKRGGPGSIAQFNVLYDSDDIYIYQGSGSYNNIVRWNILYQSEWQGYECGRIPWGMIDVDHEAESGWFHNYCAPEEGSVGWIYGNFLAGLRPSETNGAIDQKCSYCFQTSDCGESGCEAHRACLARQKLNIFNNTIVDCDVSFKTRQLTYGDYAGEVNFKNNVSYTISSGAKHFDGYDSDTSPVAVNFDYNAFDDNVGITGNLASHATTSNLNLAKTSNYRSYARGSVTTIQDILPTPNSAVIDSAIPLTTCSDCSDTGMGGVANYACAPNALNSVFGVDGNVTMVNQAELGTGWDRGAALAVCVPATPSIIDPVPSPPETEVELDKLIRSSVFADQSGCPTSSHVSSDWEIDTNSSFTSPDKYVYDSVTNKETWTPGLPENALLYVRVRHTNASGDSAWSDPVYFETVGGPVPGGPIGLLITGDNNIISWSLINGRNEESIGIKVASGAAGNKIYNVTVVNCGDVGIDVNEDVTIKNSILYNNAGPDINIVSGKTVTCSNMSIQDTSYGEGTLDGCTGDLAALDPRLGSNFCISTLSPAMNAGTDSIYSTAQVDILGQSVVDGSGSFLIGNGLCIGMSEYVSDRRVLAIQ